MIRMWEKTAKVGKQSRFCCVGSLCEGVDSNQWLPLPCKFCMNNGDIYFGKSEIILDVRVKTAFVLTSSIYCNIWTLYDFIGILCMYVVKNMGQFTYSKCTGLAYSCLHISAWELVEVPKCWVVPIWWITQAFHSFSMWLRLVKGLIWGIKTWHSLVHPFLQLL